MVRVVFLFLISYFLFLSSMDRAPRPSTASNTPVTLTETLSTLRLTHARLLEEHGSSTALLRRREAELASLAEREAEACSRVETLESDMNNMRDSLEQKAAKIRLVEREVGFLKAMVVSSVLPSFSTLSRVLNGHICRQVTLLNRIKNIPSMSRVTRQRNSCPSPSLRPFWKSTRQRMYDSRNSWKSR